MSVARRGVLTRLVDEGPATVPTLAFELGRSRQATQVLVNAMREDGLLERENNPRHRRSPSLVVTDRGRAAVAAFRIERNGALDALSPGTSDEATREATRVLAALREALEADLASA